MRPPSPSDNPGQRPSPACIVFCLLTLASLALLAYLPALKQPFISDDYVNIRLARSYGPPSGWPAMWSDSVYRVRATSWILTYWIDRLFPLYPPAFYSASMMLHVLNTWLVWALGAWRAVGWRISALAAGFFALYEGHQEAVMWYAAANELLLFLFSGLYLLCWILFLQAPALHLGWFVGSLTCFLLALASKETAVILVPLLSLAFVGNPRRPARAVWSVPFAVLAAVYIWGLWLTRPYSIRFQSGSFSLRAPVWHTLPDGLGRLLWFWGLAALAVILWRGRPWRRLAALGITWATVSLLPYSFLTYSAHLPSRHTYLASMGLAWIVAAGFRALSEFLTPRRRWVAWAVVALVISHNGAYLWWKKHRQFVARAAPTESLIAFARKVDGPIYVKCFPYPPVVAEAAVELMARKPASTLNWSDKPPGGAAVFCWQE